ncbi:MAG: ATP synthase F0 subunit B [Oligoflexia bacterium]|nr:ATP synthase F0 subunit B [Oligoflexia bacterium]
MDALIAPTLNLLVLIAILVHYVRSPVRQFVLARHTAIRDELKSVRELLRKAQEKHDEFSSKLKAIEVETTSLRDQARQDAQAFRLRLLGEAQQLSSNIVSDARSTAAGLLEETKHELYLDLGSRVLDRVEALLRERMTGEDRARFRKEFLSQMETVK